MKRNPGRPKVCMAYEDARAIVRGEMLKSRDEYRKWWMHNHPSTIPKNPNRSYVAEWQGWGDYLGTNNPFPCVRRAFRSYRDARSWAHHLRLTTKAQWLLYCKTPDFPDDVPRRPDFYYQKSRDWVTWKDFLGYTIADKMAALQDTDHIIYIIKYDELPSNVYTIGITNEGKAGLLALQAKYGFQIITGFYHDKTSDWFAVIKKRVSKYHTGEKNYIVNNVADIIFQLSTTYNQVR